MSSGAPAGGVVAAIRDEVSLRDVVAIVFRRLPAMLVIFTVVLVAALVWIFVVRDEVYETYAKLLVRIGYEQVPSVTVMARQTPIVGYRHQDVASEVQILNSTDILADVVDRLDLTREEPEPVPSGLLRRIRYEVKRIGRAVSEWYGELLIRLGLRPRLSPREQVIDALTKGLDVASSKDSNVVVARLRLNTREGISKVLDAIIERYLAVRLGHFQEQAAVDVFRQQTERTLEELRATEAELNRLERDANIVNLDAQKKVLLEQIAGLETLIRNHRISLRAVEFKLASLADVRASPGREFGRLGAFDPGSFADRLMRELASIDAERVRLEGTSFAGDQRLRDLDRRFDATLDLLGEHLAAVRREAAAAIATHERALAELRDELGSLHARETAWRDLTRRARVLEGQYAFYRQKVQEGSTTADMERRRVGSVSVIQHPTDPVRPAGIRKLYLILIAGVLGVLSALGYAVIAEFFDHHVYSAGQVERYLRTPVAGTVPFLSRERVRALVRPARARAA